MNLILRGMRRFGFNRFFLQVFCSLARETGKKAGNKNALPDDGLDMKILEDYRPDMGKSALREVPEPVAETRLPAALSIIVPVYQTEAYIRKCAESLAVQKTKYPYRVILVDDGSRDKSFEIISDMLKDNARFCVIHQENKGVSAARNRGLDSVQTEYVCFVDADDFVSEDMVELLMERAVKTGADIVVGNFSYYYEKDRKIRKNFMLDGYAETPYQLSGITCGKIFRATLFDKIRFPEGNLYEDSIVKHLLFPLASEIQCVAQPVYFYRMRENSRSSAAKTSSCCLDSTWITVRMLKDRKILGIPFDEEYQKYFLRQMAMNYQREEGVPEEIRRQVFLFMCSLAEKELTMPFSRGKHGINPEECLRRALLKRDYRTYKRLCFWM